jgi:hypothetical protein
MSEDGSRRLVHVMSSCKAISIGTACRDVNACTKGHNFPVLRKQKYNAMKGMNVNTDQQCSFGRRAEKIVEASRNGVAYRSLTGRLYDGSSANSVPLSQGRGSRFYHQDCSRRDANQCRCRFNTKALTETCMCTECPLLTHISLVSRRFSM